MLAWQLPDTYISSYNFKRKSGRTSSRHTPWPDPRLPSTCRLTCPPALFWYIYIYKPVDVICIKIIRQISVNLVDLIRSDPVWSLSNFQKIHLESYCIYIIMWKWSTVKLGRQPTADVVATKVQNPRILVGIKTCRSQAWILIRAQFMHC